jgi:hypothetical protein
MEKLGCARLYFLNELLLSSFLGLHGRSLRNDLALLEVSSLSFNKGLSVLVQSQLGDDNFGGINSNVDCGTFGNE